MLKVAPSELGAAILSRPLTGSTYTKMALCSPSGGLVKTPGACGVTGNITGADGTPLTVTIIVLEEFVISKGSCALITGYAPEGFTDSSAAGMPSNVTVRPPRTNGRGADCA